MKLMNFHHFNPNHPGEGLSRGSKQDEEVFLEFQNDLENSFRDTRHLLMRSIQKKNGKIYLGRGHALILWQRIIKLVIKNQNY